MDYKKFLAKEETLVLPYFGGTRVDAEARRFQVVGSNTAPGWWRFKIEGRRATPVERASPVELGSLPLVRGHWVSGWLVADGRTMHRIALPPDDEPAALARITGRRWYSQDLLFDTLEFEDDAEITARLALEQQRAIGDVRGVTPSLRAAFGFALGTQLAREMRIEISVPELMPQAAAIADGGADVARRVFTDLIDERQRQIAEARRRVEDARRQAEEIRIELKRRGAAATARALPRAHDPVRRADETLDAAHARLLSCRRINGNTQLDVVYEVDGARILSIVDIDTFEVIDPGICLSGAHRVLTLDAMPSVVREAIEEDHLNITRRG